MIRPRSPVFNKLDEYRHLASVLADGGYGNENGPDEIRALCDEVERLQVLVDRMADMLGSKTVSEMGLELLPASEVDIDMLDDSDPPMNLDATDDIFRNLGFPR